MEGKQKKTVTKIVKKKTSKKDLVSKKTKTDPTKLIHELIPEHNKLSKQDVFKLLEDYNITLDELPQIKITDPAIRHLQPEIDDVIQIKRKSVTAESYLFFRRVI